MRFRCGRSDAVDLSEEAVNDIYETVQRWHSKEHREMMRAHFQGTDTSKKGKTQLPRGNSGVFSVTPTLDAHEATVFALNESQPEPDTAKKPQAEGRGAASINIEEAQLRLAVELSKRESEQPEKEKAQETEKDPQSKAQAVPEEIQTEAVPEKTQDRCKLHVRAQQFHLAELPSCSHRRATRTPQMSGCQSSKGFRSVEKGEFQLPKSS